MIRGIRKTFAFAAAAVIAVGVGIGLSAAGLGQAAPAAKPAAKPAGASSKAAMAARGKYLVTIAVCNDCHTPFKMGDNGPEPDMSRMLSGHPADMTLPPPPQAAGPWLVSGAATFTARSRVRSLSAELAKGLEFDLVVLIDPDSFGAGEGMLPFFVHEACGIQPGLGLGLEAAIGPGLMRVPGQQQPFRHAKAAVVVCEGIG